MYSKVIQFSLYLYMYTCVIHRLLSSKESAYQCRRCGFDPWDQINNLNYADDTTLMAEIEEELKILLMKVKEKSEKAGFKLSIQKTKITASCPITS